jgi:hypothetical protein
MTDNECPLEAWRHCWRTGFAPLLSWEALRALRRALTDDDPKLIQGATTTPPPLACVQDWPVEAACAIGYAGWRGEELDTVGEVEEFFARMCFEADQRLGEPGGCRWLLNWFDETPRQEMRRQLLTEIDATLAQRREIRHDDA